jgi:outer membrane receptor protein involved in Fe transport
VGSRAGLARHDDLAWRHQGYFMRDDAFDGIRFDQRYDFGLPRLALSWEPSASWQAFASYAYASREPAFRDLYDAEGVGSVPLYGHIDEAAGIYADPLVKPEHVNDYELGASWHAGGASLTANLFHMDFRDELVFAGQYDTDLGYPIIGNAARSVHQGVELAGASRDGSSAAWSWRSTATSRSRQPLHRVPRELRPHARGPGGLRRQAARVLARAHGERRRARVVEGAECSRRGAVCGRVFVDNTGTDANSIAAHTVWNAALSTAGHVAGAHATLTLRGFNLGAPALRHHRLHGLRRARRARCRT